MRRSSSRGIDVEPDAADAVDAQLDRRDAAVERRPIVLHAGRHLDRLALDVHRHLQQILGAERRAGPAGERAADRDRQRRGAGDAGAGRRFAAGGQRRVLEPVVPGEQREQRQLVRRGQLRPVPCASSAGRCRSRGARAGRRSAARSATCARRLIAAFSVDAPSWNRYSGQMSIVPPARSMRVGARDASMHAANYIRLEFERLMSPSALRRRSASC